MMLSDDKSKPFLPECFITQDDLNDILKAETKKPHFKTNHPFLVIAIFSGYLYWSSSKPGGQRWANATGLPIFPVAPQVGGSSTNAIFNYVTFRQLSEAIMQPIGHFSNSSTEMIFRIIHWIAASAIGISTTIPQWYISLHQKDAKPTPITISAILNVLVQTQGASLLLKSIYFAFKKTCCKKQGKIEKQIKNLELLKKDSDALNEIIGNLNEGTSPAHFIKLLLEYTPPKKPAKRSWILTVIGSILAALGLWLNVPISIGTYVDTTQLTHSMACGIVTTLFTGIANAGYYLFEFKMLFGMLNTSSITTNQDNPRCEMMLIFIIGLCSLFSGFTVDQINWVAFENDFSREWLWTTSIMANLGAALFYNLIQSLLAPGILLGQPQRIRQQQELKKVIDKVTTGLPENSEPIIAP